MRTLSAAYLAAAKAAGRYPDLYAIIYGTNDTLTISGKNAIISAYITRGDTSKPSYFEVGRAISSSATLTVDRRKISDESYIASGAKIEIYAEFDTPAGVKIDDEIIATMYISGYDTRDRDIGQIFAIDRLVYTGGDFNPDNLTYPVTLSDMLTEAFDQSGLSGVTTMLPVNPHVNSAPYQADEPVADGMSGDPYTCRDIIGKIAGMQMSDLFMDANGQPKVYGYGAYITGAITDNMIYELSVSAESFAVNQVLVYKSDKRMPKDDAHYEVLPYSPRFEDMDDISSGGTWWDQIVDRALVFARQGWTTCRATFAGVGELEPGDFVTIGSGNIPAFITGIEYEFSNAAFCETIYSFAYTLEEYYQAPTKSTVVSTDAKKPGGVGEALNNHSERFNDYENNTSAGYYEHIEGKNNKTINGGYANHLGGQENTGDGCNSCRIDGNGNSVKGEAHGVDGYHNIVKGQGNGVSGKRNNVDSEGNLTGGLDNTVSGRVNVVGGEGNTVTGDYNNVSGDDNTVSGNRASVSGRFNSVSGGYGVTSGYKNTVMRDSCCTVGEENTNGTSKSVLCGEHNINNEESSIMCGKYGSNTGNYIYVGGGTSANSRACLFRVDTQGEVYTAGAYHNNGADYAEYFEWADGNPHGEDRRGMLVALDGNKLVPAQSDDILGAVSAALSVVGDAYEEHWRGKYITDVFGRIVRDKDGAPLVSPEYDDSREYKPRSKRPEWAAVGLIGKLIVCDNGECRPGGYVSAYEGKAVPTLHETRVRCIKRIDGTHIVVFVR